MAFIRFILLILFAVSLSCSSNIREMTVVSPYEINDPSSQKKVLIATQGSPYKDAVTKALAHRLSTHNVYVKIIDVTGIEKINAGEWDAVVVIHTWEKFSPQPDAKTFLKQNYNPEKVFVLTTSGSGSRKIKGVDAITGASPVDLSETHANELAGKVEEALGIKN